jgi:hypothetical protein
VQNMVRCKACGYIMPEAKLGDKCPACGALRTVFEPYINPIAEPRQKVLNMHLHPIAVHFPTVLAVAILVFSAATPFFSGNAQALLISTVRILALFLPLVTIIAIVMGVVDGKTRFRKIKNSEILKTKIVYGSILFVFSLGLIIVVWLKGFNEILFAAASIVLATGAVAFSAVLALLGMSITNSAFPGK